ncbi:hypothetical protein QFZ77_007644 [Paenibacillus sp. V4I3]|uniref:hypothetical protein n=1 Tax=Paenibacillus sp. V4I3 TaxID=3042305 RepID=UPI00278B7F80|nr:hypothetical protein [Paenibacillus sp. V4I3]MDQ0878985.1 hypothetical protein [Paenibacillus sp. V4I3]
MENLECILYTDTLKQLYNEVSNQGSPIPIIFEIVQKTELNVVGSAGHCQLIIEPQGLHIRIKIRDDRVNEDVISHELLHAKHIRNGYSGGIACIETNSIIERIGSSLSNTLEHVLIYQTQDHLNVKRSESSKILQQMLDVTHNERSDLQMLLSALAILECKVRGDLGYDELIDQIAKKYPLAYTIALHIFELIDAEKLVNPFSFRRSIIKILSYLETISFADQKTKTIPFRKMIAVSFVPSRRQLTQTVSTVFVLKHNYFGTHYTGILSRAEDQLSFLIVMPSQKDIENLPLADFFAALQYPYQTRD